MKPGVKWIFLLALASCAGTGRCVVQEAEPRLPEVQCSGDDDCPQGMYCAEPSFLAACEDAPRCGACK